MIEVIVFVFCVVLLFMTIVYAIALRLDRLDIVDIGWGGACAAAAMASFFLGEMGVTQYIVTGLVIVWAARLSSSILRRFRSSRREDARYTEMRRAWKGNFALNAYFRIFVVQALLATLVSLSVIVINVSAVHDVTWVTIVGVLVWLFGFLFETIGDRQLRQHLANDRQKGALMTSGLWRYTRHPNYFGEATQWWGIFVIALGVPFGWLSIIAPLTITVLLLFISGVPLTEKRFEGRSGWTEYKRRTSVFIPLPPRK